METKGTKNMSNENDVENDSNISVDPCKKFACEWQTCLERFSYREEKCADVIERLRKCCLETYGSRLRPISPTCSGFIRN